MTEKPNKLKPALIGGLIAGVLTAIPGVGLGCCVWGLVGGAVAAYMLIKRSPVFRVTTGDGAITGLFSGLFGSLIALAIIPRVLGIWGLLVERIKQQGANQSDPSAQQTVNNFVAFLQNNPVLGAFMFWLLVALTVIGSALLGGIIGVAIFEKRKADSYPPQGPPPDYPPPNFAPPEGPGGPEQPNQPPY